MTYKVTVSSGNNYSVKVSQPSNIKTSSSYTIEIMPQKLEELIDVQISGYNDKYVLMYDSSIGKWKDVDPDDVLNAAITTNSGLPNTFINELDVNLDNKIDLDGGEF